MLLFPTGYKLWYIILPLFSLYCFSLIYMATLRLICGPWDFHSAEACRIFTWALWDLRASQVELVVKNPPANAGSIRDVGSIRVGRIPWRRAWQPSPGFLPGASHGQRGLAGPSPQGGTESDTTEGLCTHSIFGCDRWDL